MTADTPSQAAPKVRIVRTQATPTIYIEGISQMLVGFPNSRITLASLQQPAGNSEQQEEVHHVACELVVPTAALIEIAQGILHNLGNSKAELQALGAEWQQKVHDVLENIPTNNTPPNGE